MGEGGGGDLIVEQALVVGAAYDGLVFHFDFEFSIRSLDVNGNPRKLLFQRALSLEGPEELKSRTLQIASGGFW